MRSGDRGRRLAMKDELSELVVCLSRVLSRVEGGYYGVLARSWTRQVVMNGNTCGAADNNWIGDRSVLTPPSQSSLACTHLHMLPLASLSIDEYHFDHLHIIELSVILKSRWK